MASGIPVIIALARERAGSFRRCVEILHAAWQDPPSHFALQEALVFIQEFAKPRSSCVPLGTPFVTLEWALGWANSIPPPPVAVLREARAALEATASDWADSILLLHDMTKRRLDLGGAQWPDWLFAIAGGAAAEKRRIEVVLRESWPVSAEVAERQALEETRNGKGLELEGAFAQMAGVSKEEWQRMVAEHKSKK